MKAEIMKVKGGARAIATMTFDDGLVKTANTLNELCERYGCRASLMMCTYKLNDGSAELWRGIFDKGYLNPESHSRYHKYLTPSHPENLTEEIMKEEIEDSLSDLKKYLPRYDSLTFGIPYSSYAPEAYELLYRNYYAARGGICVLYNESARGKVQSLDPKSGNRDGDWYNPYGIRMMPEKSQVYPMITPDAIIEHLDRCVEREGWFLSVVHGTVEGENLDITVSDLARIMERMQYHAEHCDLWVATYTDAVKYIRERQNTALALSAREDGADITLTMADKTEDGLPLPASVFNIPLTVRLELPLGVRGAEWTQGGEKHTVPARLENGVAYAYLDIVPDGTSVTVSIVK